ncbi:MAG: hypothetical protein ACTSRW_12905 [Candidatus Helarchaeota archaeon]
MVNIITQIFTSTLVPTLVGAILCVKNHKKDVFLGSIVGAPLGWIGEIVCIALGFWVYSIRELIPLFGLPLPVWFGWWFVMLHASAIFVYIIESVQTHEEQFQDTILNRTFFRIFGFSLVIYLAPVFWGLLIAIPIYFLFHLFVADFVLLQQFPLLWDVFGLDPFSYFAWISLMILGVFMMVFFASQVVKREKTARNWLPFLIIPIAAFGLAPLGWGIEFFGVNSHAPIWSYTPHGNILFILGPFGIPLIIYTGWYVFLGIVSLVISYRMKFISFQRKSGGKNGQEGV